MKDDGKKATIKKNIAIGLAKFLEKFMRATKLKKLTYLKKVIEDKEN